MPQSNASADHIMKVLACLGLVFLVSFFSLLGNLYVASYFPTELSVTIREAKSLAYVWSFLGAVASGAIVVAFYAGYIVFDWLWTGVIYLLTRRKKHAVAAQN